MGDLWLFCWCSPSFILRLLVIEVLKFYPLLLFNSIFLPRLSRIFRIPGLESRLNVWLKSLPRIKGGLLTFYLDLLLMIYNKLHLKRSNI